MSNLNINISEIHLKDIKFALEKQLDDYYDQDREMLREASYNEDWEMALSIAARVTSAKDALKIVEKLIQDIEKKKTTTELKELITEETKNVTN